ncbi:MAG: hypothetical protein J5604_01940 [Bacteroidales bacterium]|nr:hypothetical protein [Bacteroidales bacterium]
MKRLFSYFLLVLLAVFFISCSKDKDEILRYEYPDGAGPGWLIFTVEDQNGNCLLNPDNPNNILLNSTLSYKNKIYSFFEDVIPYNSLHPQLTYGFQSITDNNGSYSYIFGKWSENGKTEEIFTINIAGKASHTIIVRSEWVVENIINNTAYMVQKKEFYMDGVEYKSPRINEPPLFVIVF